MPAFCREAAGKNESEIRQLARQKLVPVVDKYFPENGSTQV